MSNGVEYICKCGNEKSFLTGIGMLYFSMCEDTYNEILAGKWGEDWKSFVTKHPNGKLDLSKQLYKCPICNDITSQSRDIYYVESDNIKVSEHYYFESNLPEEIIGEKQDIQYEFIKQRQHFCEKCKVELEEIDESQLKDNVICEKCGRKMELHGIIFWD